MVRLISDARYVKDRDGRLCIRGIFDGKIVNVPTEVLPYFFVRAEDRHVVEKLWEVKNVEDVDLKYRNEKKKEWKVVKVECDVPSKVANAREYLRKKGIESYEADIIYVRRMLIDEVIKVGYDYDCVAFVDVELDDSKGLPINYGKDEIVSIAVWTMDGEREWFYVKDYDTERQMLEAFIGWLRANERTVLVGWNVGFDQQHITNRSKTLGIKDEWLWYVHWFDLREEYKNNVKGLESYSLEEVTEYEGMRKKQRTKRICDMNRQELEEYNLYDVEACAEIEKKYGFVGTWLEVACITNLRLSELSPVNMAESEILKRLREIGYVGKNKPEVGREDEKSYRGAIVLQPIAGVHRNVVYLDFSAMYPNIIINERIDIDGFDGEVLPVVVDRMLSKRKEYKKLYKETGERVWDIKQQAMKPIVNSFYGVLANRWFRWRNRTKAEAITNKGRELIMKTKEYVESVFGFKVIYADSVAKDSIIVVREDGKIRIIKIEELFNGEPDMVIGGKEYKFLNGVETITINEKGKLVWKPIKYVMRHKTDKKMFRVWLSNKWYVDVTEDHSIYGYVNVLKRRKVKADRNGLVEISPKEIGKNVKSIAVLNGMFAREDNVTERDIKIWEFIGFAVGDGSWGGSSYGAKYYIRLSFGDDLEELEKKLLEPLKKWKIITNWYREKKGDVKVLAKKLVELLNEFKDENGKKIPKWVVNMPIECIRAFLRGYFTADGTVIVKRGRPIVRATTVNGRIAETIRMLLFAAGISNSIIEERNQNRWIGKGLGTYSKHVYVKDVDRFAKEIGFLLDRKNERLMRCNVRRKEWKKGVKDKDFDIQPVMKVEEIRYNDYVYDVEVEETHRFFANWVLVHNTDSVFVKVHGIGNVDEFAKLLEFEINEVIKPYEVKLEALFDAVLFLRGEGEEGVKKRYIGITKDGEWVWRGVEKRRSDWCRLSKIVQEKVAEMLLKEGKSKEDVLSYMAEVKRRMFKGEFDDMLIIAKGYKKLEDYKANQPHVRALRKMISKGIVPVEDKIRFVYVAGRDVEPILNDMDIEKWRGRLNYKYYWQAQIWSPIKRILDSIDNGGGRQIGLDKFGR